MEEKRLPEDGPASPALVSARLAVGPYPINHGVGADRRAALITDDNRKIPE